MLQSLWTPSPVPAGEATVDLVADDSGGIAGLVVASSCTEYSHLSNGIHFERRNMGIGSDALKILRSMRSPFEKSVFNDSIPLDRVEADLPIGKKAVRLHPTAGDTSLSDLDEKLTLIQEALSNRARAVPEGELNDFQAINEFARLEQLKIAAKKGDWAQADRYLRQTHRWVYDLAASIGVSFPTSLRREKSEIVEPQPSSPGSKGGGRERLKTFKPSNAIVVSSHFKLVFLSVLAITILSGTVQTAMAFTLPEPKPIQRDVFEAMGFAWKLCLGAIVGLLGGKSIK
ncbi:hypothetical protein [Bradyrhizobium sp. LA7.1]|uniref:hypothetical protein n=1 Tax=Bradyrhizobium sp. LA7.1 TaxID=3156324 RepID=UPI003398D86D